MIKLNHQVYELLKGEACQENVLSGKREFADLFQTFFREKILGPHREAGFIIRGNLK